MKSSYYQEHQQDSRSENNRMEVTAAAGPGAPPPKKGESSPSGGGDEDIVLHPRCRGVAKTTGTFLVVIVVALLAFRFCSTAAERTSTSPMISSIVEPDEYGQARSPAGPLLLPVISSSGSTEEPDGSNGKLQTTINQKKNNDHDEKEDEDVNNLRNDAPIRMLQEEGVDCVLSDETPFVYLMLLKLNSPPQDICVGAAAADDTFGVLSENDAAQIKNAIVTTFTILAQRYCDPYFRNVKSVEIVRQGISPSAQSPSSQEGGALTLEIKVLGALRCKESEEGCDVDKIGLFDLPKQEGTVDLEQQEQTCACPASNNTVSSIVSNRGPTEPEFMEKLDVVLGTFAPSTLDCPDLQVAKCAFGTLFEFALEITFANPEGSRNASGRIGPEALSTFNEFYTPDNFDVCYPEFRVFQTATIAFQDARRQMRERLFYFRNLAEVPSTEPGSVSPPPSLVKQGPASSSSTVAPSDSPTTLLGGTSSAASVAPTQSPSSLFAASSLTIILFVGGVCSECGSEVFFDNDVSARRRLLRESFQQATVLDRPLSGRKLQDMSNMTTESNCFCPIDSQVVASPFLALEQFKTTLEERLQLEILGIQQVEPGDIDNLYRYTCTDVATTFQRNVTLEVQAACGSADLSADDETKIELAYITTYNGLGSALCDPFKLQVTSAKVVETGDFRADGVSLPLKLELTLDCFGCDPLNTSVYGFPQSPIKETAAGSEGDARRHLYGEGGVWCSCEATLPRRAPLEAEVLDALRLSLFQAQEDVGLDCPDLQVAECSFGTVFELALAIKFADPEASRSATGRIGPETLSTFNEFYNPDNDSDLCFPEFRVFQTASVAFPDARRKLQQIDAPRISPSESPTTLDGGSSAASVAPTQSPSALFAAPSLTAIVNVVGVCSGCGSEVFLDNDVSARRRNLRESFRQAMVNRPLSGRKLQDMSNMTTESNCFCPIDSQVVASPFLALEQFKTTLEERLQLEILGIQQVEPGDIDNLYRYTCTDVATTFQRNVTLEVQAACGSADLSADDETKIELAYITTYNGLGSALCDPFKLQVTSAKVVETGDFRADGVSLPLKLELTLDCFGCDPLNTNVYGFPQSPLINEGTAGGSGSEGAARRFLYGEGGTCACNSTLPRRAPLEAEVVDALRLSLWQAEDAGQTSCVANTTTCDFGRTGFTSSVLVEFAVNDTLSDPQETATILQTAYTNALNRVVGGGNATQCNPWFGAVTDTESFFEFVYNSVETTTNQTAARRQLQAAATEGPTASSAPTSEPTSVFMYSWSGSGANISDTPTAAPTTLSDDNTQFVVLDAFGVCNGCPTELIFSNAAADGRRRIDQISTEDKTSSKTITQSRLLQDVAGEVPESDCYCPIGSVEIVPDLQQVSLLLVIQDELAQLSNTITIVEAVSGLTRVECVAETSFSTTIDFAFSAFEWVVNNPEDVQGLGDAIAKVYNSLVGNFCDEYFRNSISLTFVAGSLQRTSAPAQRHNRDLQNSMQGCFNFQATFSVTGLCRGCQALGTPIPLFGNSTISRRLLDELTRQEPQRQESKKQRRLQEATGLTCLCDGTSISQRSAPSRGAIRAGLASLIPDQLPWAQNPSICGLPVQVEVPCPTIPTGPSTTMTLRFYARLSNGGCLKVADLQQISTLFYDAFNSNMQLERFTCEPGYLQISNVVIDQSSLVGCRRELLRGEKNNGIASSGTKSTPRQLLQDFTVMFASMTVTGNIYAANIDAILAGEGATLRTAADSIAAGSLGIYEIESGTATSTPSAMPSAFPSSFPSAFPSSFPSTLPSAFPSAFPSTFPTEFPTSKPSSVPTEASCLPTSKSCTGIVPVVQAWCDLFNGTNYKCCTGNVPCEWADEATIFKGSCNGNSVCRFADTATSITVGANSCNWDVACDEIGDTATSISIGSNSCNGWNACKWIAQYKGETISIGDGSCNEVDNPYGNPCIGIGRESATSVTVGDDSCNGYGVCAWMGTNKATSVAIGTDSCIGEGACYYLGLQGATAITVGDQSCHGYYACFIAAYALASTTVTVGAKSCIGQEACYFLGGYEATSVNIEDSTCTADVCNSEPLICGGPSDYCAPALYENIAGDVNCDACKCVSSTGR